MKGAERYENQIKRGYNNGNGIILVHATPCSCRTGRYTESFQEENKDTEAICIIDMTEKVYNSLTRMPSVVDGKTQVMALSVENLKSNSYVDGYDYGKSLNPGTRQTYYVVCTARSSGTTADVGLAYYNSQGKYIINSKTSLSGYDSYGTVSATPTFKNYGYVKNTGSAKLTASYVYMK